jgi:hypothetical protein
MVAFPGDILDFGNSVRFISSLAWLVMSLCGQPPQAPIVATWKLFSKSNVYYLRDKSHYVNTLQYCYSIVHDPNFPSTERVHIAKQERDPIYQRDLFLLIFSGLNPKREHHQTTPSLEIHHHLTKIENK